MQAEFLTKLGVAESITLFFILIYLPPMLAVVHR